jgi:hypothetical protein
MRLLTRRLLTALAALALPLLIIFAVGVRAADQRRIYAPLISSPAVATAVASATATQIATPTTAPTATAAPDSCPDESFLSVSSANSGYPDPVLNVSCANGQLVVNSNGIPNFAFVKKTPNDLVAQNYTWRIPLVPVAAAATTALPLGAVGFAVNGLPIYGPMEAPAQGSADPLLDGILDYCNGHTGPRGEYHLHARPECIFTTIDGQVGLVIGYAFDGYPILAPYLCADSACSTTRELKSSYQKTSEARNAWEANSYVAGSGDLDQCNGMTSSDGSYRYYATTSFPYFMGCFHGEVDLQAAQGASASWAAADSSAFICHLPTALAPARERAKL